METPATRACGIHAARLNLADYASNFGDAHPPLTRAQALIEAERCYYCFEAPCTTACPTGIDVPTFIQRIAQGNNRGAARDDPRGQSARRHVRPRLPDRGAVRAGLRAQRARGQAGRDRRTAAPCHRRAVRRAGRAAVHAGGRDRPARRRRRRRSGRAGLRARPGAARPRGGAVRGPREARRLERVRPGHLQDRRQLRAAEIAWLLSIGGIEVRTGQRLGRDITLARPARRVRRGVSRPRAGRGQRARRRRTAGRRACATRSSSSPNCASPTRRRCRSAGACSSSAAA